MSDQTETNDLKIKILELVALHPNYPAFQSLGDSQKETVIENIIGSAQSLMKDGYTEYESITSGIVLWMRD